jgi:hypothetical protein
LNTKQFRFNEVASAPDTPGVYAWYYRIELTDRDISVCIADVEAQTDFESKKTIIRSFLDRRLFRYYKDQGYSVELSGPLKPRYSGKVEHKPDISSSLISRVAESPTRLHAIKNTLKLAVPQFASPIYIGVAKQLRGRLMQHVRLIESLQQIRSSAIASGSVISPTSEEDENDHKFAYEVTMLRDFATSSLVVNTFELSVDSAIRYDLENILNRINYPLCGRK